MITKKKLCWKKNGQIYSAHLLTNKQPAIVGRNIAVHIDDNDYYVHCERGSSSNMLTIQAKYAVNQRSYSWYATDITPTIVIASNITNDPQPYKDPYRIDSLTMSMNVSINKPIELQYRSQWPRNWYTIMTLPADGVYASLDSIIRIDSMEWRIRIGSWTNEFNQYTGSDSTTRQIPEAQWGV